MASSLRTALARWRWAREQRALRAQLVERDDFPWALRAGEEGRRQFRLVGGLDISFFSDGGHPADNRACVALIVCEFDERRETLEIVWKDFILVRMLEPYIAGFLAFREARHYCEMFRRLEAARPDLMPDVVLVDGNGVLHPRGFGVASHVGVLADKCTIGVAKNLHMVDGLSRDHVKERCQAAPDTFVPLVGASGRTWGAALLPVPRRPPSKHSATPKNPIFISVGHRVGLEACVAVVSECLIGARVPEPVRQADVLSREEVRKAREKEKKESVPVEVRGEPRGGVSAAGAAAAALGAVGLLLLLQRSRRRLLN